MAARQRQGYRPVFGSLRPAPIRDERECASRRVMVPSEALEAPHSVKTVGPTSAMVARLAESCQVEDPRFYTGTRVLVPSEALEVSHSSVEAHEAMQPQPFFE